MKNFLLSILLIIIIIASSFYTYSTLYPKEAKKITNSLNITEETYRTIVIKPDINSQDIVIPQNTTFTLELDNNIVKSYENKYEDTINNPGVDPSSYVRVYKFENSYKDINSYLIKIELYNSEEYLLVNKKTGNEISIPGSIVISPDKKNIVSFNSDLENKLSYNGFKIIKLINDDYEEVYALETDWGPKEVKWVGNTGLEFKKTILDENYDEKITGSVRYKLINNKWTEVK